MASFDPNRSTAQAMTELAGVVSKAADRSSTSSRNCVSSDLLATMLTFTTLSVVSPQEQCACHFAHAPQIAAQIPVNPVNNNYQENPYRSSSIPRPPGWDAMGVELRSSGH